MATVLSEKAQAFLKEKHFAVLSTLNKDGSPQLTTMWYFLADDGTIYMNSLSHLYKIKNIRRDPRIALCIEDGNRYASINGTIEIIDDQATNQRVIHDLIKRYIEDEETQEKYLATFLAQPRVVLHLHGEKATERFLDFL